MQFTDFEDVHLGHRQLHEYAKYFGQQRCGTAHGDVADFAQGIAEAYLQLVQHRRRGGWGWRRRGGLGIEQAQFYQGSA
ncbi:hypothetical protein D3C77_782640 [compost metagenome]